MPPALSSLKPEATTPPLSPKTSVRQDATGEALSCAGVPGGCWVSCHPLQLQRQASPQATCTHLFSLVGYKQQLGSMGQVAAGSSPLGIAATLITPLELPLLGCTLGGYSKAAGFSFSQPLLQLAASDFRDAGGAGLNQNKHAERLSPENLYPKAPMGL